MTGQPSRLTLALMMGLAAIQRDEPAECVLRLVQAAADEIEKQETPDGAVLDCLIATCAAFATSDPAAQALADRLTVLRLKMLA